MSGKAGMPPARATTSRRAELRAIAHLTRPHRRLAAIAWTATMLRPLFLTTVPLLASVAIDDGVSANNGAVLVVAGVGMAIAILLAGICLHAREVQGYVLADRVTVSLQKQVFDRVQALTPGQVAELGSGTLISRVINDAPKVRLLFVTGLSLLLRGLSGATISLIAMFYLDWQLTLVALAILPIFLAATWIYRKRSQPWYERGRDSIAEVTTIARNSFNTMPLVHDYARQADVIQQFAAANERNREVELRPIVQTAIFEPVTALLGSISVGLLIIVGGTQAVNGEAGVGTIVAFVGLISGFFTAATQLTSVTANYESGMAAVDKAYQLLRTPDAMTSPTDPQSMPEHTQSLSFVNANYVSRTTRIVSVVDVTLDIPAGQSTALVGPLRSGRSTLAGLLGRTISLTSGELRYGGSAVADFDLADYRQVIHYVPVKPMLFSATVRQTLGLAAEMGLSPVASADSDLDEICEQVLTALGGARFVERLPDGLDTQIQLGAKNLSDVQRAIIAVARSVMARPHVLVLDRTLDLGSGADLGNVVATLEELIPDATLILATSRKEIASRCSQVVVMDEGRVRATGSYLEFAASWRELLGAQT